MKTTRVWQQGMQGRRRHGWAVVVLGTLASCMSTGKDPREDPLDVTLQGTAQSKGREGFDWRQYFKAAPSGEQRAQLQASLEGWKGRGSADELLKKGRQELALGRVGQAESSIREAVRVNEDLVEGWIELASLMLRKNQIAQAYDVLAEVRERFLSGQEPPTEWVLRYKYLLAIAHIRNQDRDRGHRLLSELIGFERSFVPAYAALASSYIGGGKLAVAEFVIQRGIERGGEDASLQNLRGVIAERRGHLVQAEQFYRQALATNATFVPARINRGNLSTARGDYRAAEMDLAEALKLQPENVSALVGLGVVQMRQGLLDAAEGSFRRALLIDGDSAGARYNLGVLMAQARKRPEDARRLFAEVLQSRDEDVQTKKLARSYLEELKSDHRSEPVDPL